MIKDPKILGVVCAFFAAMAFSSNDLIIKLLSSDYPLHQVVFIRATLGLTVTLFLLMPLEGGLKNLRTCRPLAHFARGLCVVFANMAFFTSIASLPLADATAIFFVSPLIITAFSVVFLKEKVGIRRWAAVIVGLIGVIIVVRPGSGSFQLVALLPLLAAIGYALLHIITRKIGLTESASTMAFYIQLSFIVVSASIGLAFGDGAYSGSANPSMEFLLRAWIWPTSNDWILLAFLGLSSALGGYLISQAYRVAEAGLVAPFEYTALVMSVIWGITIWGHWPIATTWAGIALILASGLFIAFREAHLGRTPSARKTSARR
ncbi:MAG: DMT family transporter [Pikeienuella sp.]